MSAQPVTARRPRSGGQEPPPVARAACCAAGSRSAAGLALVVVAVLSLVEPADKAVREIKLPLRHEDIIRQQAADKNVDPTLIAAVIYTESRFRDQTSHAGAKGLMQIMPETADYIARKSGGTRFDARRPRDAADQHRLRHLVPALPAGQVRRQHDPHPGRLQRGGGQGRPVVARGGGPRRAASASPITSRSRRPATTSARAVRARRLPRELQARAASGISRPSAPRHWGYRRHRPHIHPRF